MSDRFEDLVAAQDGLVTWGEARRLGYSEAGIGRRVASGAWVRVGPRVYDVAAAPLTHARAARAVLLGLPRGVASCTTAAHLWGIELVDPPDEVHVAVEPTLRRRAGPGVVQHRRAVVVARAPGGLPVTTLVRTLVDLAATLPEAHAVASADSALRLGLVTEAELRAVAERAAGRRYGLRVRAIFGAADPRSGSVLESLLRMALVAAGLPRPVSQYEVRDARGRFVGRVDFAYPEAGLVIEADGFGFHSSPMDFVADRRRQNALVDIGLRVLRFTYADVLVNPAAVAGHVRRALRSAA